MCEPPFVSSLISRRFRPATRVTLESGVLAVSISAHLEGDPYIQWLQKRNTPLFEGGGILWRTYQGCLVPACLKPQPVRLSPGQSRDLLNQSGSRFLRYFTTVYNQPTEFWYTACNRYNAQTLCKETPPRFAW